MNTPNDKYLKRVENINKSKPWINSTKSRVSKEKCVAGHPFNEHNTYSYPYEGVTRRYCRQCQKDRRLKYRLRGK